MEEERENDNKASSPDKGDSAGGWAGQRQELNLSSAYLTLLDQYREALARIHVLEMQNQNLENTIKSSPPPIVSQDRRASIGASEATDLVARITAVESLLASSIADGPGPTTAEEPGLESASRDEVAQLRIQVQSLLGQLSKVDGRIDDMKWARAPSGGRRRSSPNRRSWMSRILKR